jgi:molecular chaperone DnaK
VFTKLIDRNTTIPARRSEVFSTAEDNQDSVEVHVLQGERDMASFNKTLGKFHLTGLPPAPRGVPQIEVTFDIDANGIVHVSAKDRATGKEQAITITGQSTLSKEEIDQMVADAEAHAAEDKRRREEAEVRNTADTLAWQAERMLSEQADKLTDADKASIEGNVAAVHSALEDGEIEAIRTATEELSAVTQAATQHLYDASPGSEASAGSTGGDDDIVDAEIVDDDTSTAA